MRLELNWTVPNGTHQGDTFTVALPPEIQTEQGLTFPLVDKAGNVVANGKVVGQAVVFTMTTYAEEHDDISGDAWFEVTWNSEVVTPGSSYDLTFTSGDTTFRDTVVIDPLEPHLKAGKWMDYVITPPEGLAPDDHLRWGVHSPVFTAKQVGATVTLTDMAGAGQAIDCTTIYVSINTFDELNRPVFVARLPRAKWTASSCTSARASVSFVVTGSLTAQRATFTGWSAVTDSTLTEYSNAGEVTVAGHTDPVSALAVKSRGGGSGTGYKVVSVGDLVWFDANHDGIQDQGEPGIEGATLTLTGPDGGPVTTTKGVPVGPVVTTASGGYLFAGLPALPAGQHYTVSIDARALPACYAPTLTGAGTPATDSSTGTATSVDLTKNGAQDPTLDFGFWCPKPAIDIEKLDTAGNDADTVADAVDLGDSPGKTGLVFPVKNTGMEPLVDVVVSNTVVANGTVTGLVCTFPDGSTGLSWAGPFAPGGTLSCAAKLSGVLPGDPHHGVATVTGVGERSQTPVTDSDAYFATASPGLPVTGSSVTGVMALGLGLLGAGLMFLVGSRRRRTTR
jgi:hypothetical protein